jgi:hypothetical protein
MFQSADVQSLKHRKQQLVVVARRQVGHVMLAPEFEPPQLLACLAYS